MIWTLKKNRTVETRPLGALSACMASVLLARCPLAAHAAAQATAAGATSNATGQAPAAPGAGGTPSASPATPQTPGTATSPGTSAGSATGQGATPVAASGIPTATAASSFGADTTGTPITGAVNNGGSLPGTSRRPEDPNFDLSRTLQSALGSSSAIVQARRNQEISQRRVDEVNAQSRPTLTANGSASRFDAPTKVQFGGGPPVQVLPDHTEVLGIALTERLDLLGQIRATVNEARLQAAADLFTIDALSNSRTLQATTIYFNLLRAIHQVQVAQSALQNAQAQQSVANRLYLGQIGQKIDLLRATTLTAQAEQNLIAAENQRDIARESFNDLTGRPLNASVVLQDIPGVTIGVDITPTSAAGAPVGTTAAPAFVPFPAPTAEVGAINLDQKLTDAQTLRPEILQNAVLVRVAETGTRIARFGQEPTFAVSATGNYYPTPSFQTPRQRTAGLTATISLPLYDGGATRARIAEARLRQENAQTLLESARSGVALDVRQEYLNLSTAARQITAANAALTQAVAARQLAQVRYEGQVGLFLEVTDAQAALVRAENAQVDAVYNYLIARARFENAAGTPALAVSAASPTRATTVPTAPDAPASPVTRP